MTAAEFSTSLPKFIERGTVYEEMDDEVVDVPPDRFHSCHAPEIGQNVDVDITCRPTPSGRTPPTVTLRGRVVDVIDARHVEVRLQGRRKSLPRRLQRTWRAWLERDDDLVTPWFLRGMEPAASAGPGVRRSPRQSMNRIAAQQIRDSGGPDKQP